jgi:hypothetical protein
MQNMVFGVMAIEKGFSQFGFPENTNNPRRLRAEFLRTFKI